MIQTAVTPEGKKFQPVHFLCRKGSYGGTYVLVLACSQHIEKFCVGRRTPLYKRTEEPRAVTCPQCKATQEYQSALQEMGLGS